MDRFNGREVIRRLRRLRSRTSVQQDEEREDETGDSLAHDLIYNGTNVTNRVRQIIDSLPEEMRQDLLITRNDAEMTLFDLAVDSDKRQLVDHILASLKDNERFELLSTEQPGLGWTPLHRAVVRGNHAIVSMMLASINQTQQVMLLNSESGQETVARALLYGTSNVVEALLGQLESSARYQLLRMQLDNDQTLMHQLIMSRRYDATQWVLRNLDSSLCLSLAQHLKDGRGRTILHLALKLRDIRMMRIILECLNQRDRNCVLLERDSRGSLAIHYAAESTSRQFSRRAVRLIMNSMSQELIPFMVTQRTDSNRTPFERAFEVGNIDAMQEIARALQKKPNLLSLHGAATAVPSPRTRIIVSSPTQRGAIPRQPSTETIGSIDDVIEDDLSTLPLEGLMTNIRDSLTRTHINNPKDMGENIPSTKSSPPDVRPRETDNQKNQNSQSQERTLINNGIQSPTTITQPESTITNQPDTKRYASPPTDSSRQSASSRENPKSLVSNPPELDPPKTLQTTDSTSGQPSTLVTRPNEMTRAGTSSYQHTSQTGRSESPHMDDLKQHPISYASYSSVHHPDSTSSSTKIGGLKSNPVQMGSVESIPSTQDGTPLTAGHQLSDYKYHVNIDDSILEAGNSQTQHNMNTAPTPHSLWKESTTGYTSSFETNTQNSENLSNDEQITQQCRPPGLPPPRRDDENDDDCEIFV